jgi:hypothetical protein
LILLVLCAGFVIWAQFQKVYEKLEVLEIVRSGSSIQSVLDRGYKPYIETPIDYEGKSAKAYLFRSSEGVGARTIDFGLIVNESGIVVVALRLSSDSERETWDRLTQQK